MMLFFSEGPPARPAAQHQLLYVREHVANPATVVLSTCLQMASMSKASFLDVLQFAKHFGRTCTLGIAWEVEQIIIE